MKYDILKRVVQILYEQEKFYPGPKMLPDEIWVGVLFWGDLQCNPGFMVTGEIGQFKDTVFSDIPIKPSKEIPTQSWALIYNYR